MYCKINGPVKQNLAGVTPSALSKVFQTPLSLGMWRVFVGHPSRLSSSTYCYDPPVSGCQGHQLIFVCYPKETPMIDDLIQIRLMGEKKRPENEHFRRYLKSHDHSDRRLRRMAEDIQEQIDCTTCANCCRVATTGVSERDIERLARHLGTTPGRFVSEYTAMSEDGLILKRGEGGCVFLEGHLCSIY